MSLAEFLLARIPEDEALLSPPTARRMIGGTMVDVPIGHLPDYVVRDRKRWAAECEAKRRIVEHHQYWQQSRTSTFEGWTGDTATAYRMAMDWTLQLLALPYADHPDYLPDWRPDPVNAE